VCVCVIQGKSETYPKVPKIEILPKVVPEAVRVIFNCAISQLC